MVLHHLSNDKMKVTLDNFALWTGTGGYLLIQEHDVGDGQHIRPVLEILHGFYIFIKNSEDYEQIDSISKHYSNYFSQSQLIEMLSDRWNIVSIDPAKNQMSNNYMMLLRRK